MSVLVLAVTRLKQIQIGHNGGRLWQLPQLPTTVCYRSGHFGGLFELKSLTIKKNYTMTDNLSKAYQEMTLDQLKFMLTIAQLACDEQKILVINNYIQEKLKS